MNYERESKKDIWTTHASIVKRKLLIAVITLNVYYLDQPPDGASRPEDGTLSH